MQIENEKIDMAPLAVSQHDGVSTLSRNTGGPALDLSESQAKVIGLLMEDFTLKEAVEHFFQQGDWFPFQETKDMLEFMIDNGLLLTPGFKSYFRRDPAKPGSPLEAGTANALSQHSQNVVEDAKNLPFFRVLSQPAVKTLFEHCALIDCPPDTAICLMGQVNRSLYVLVKGLASVFKRSPDGSYEKVAVLSSGAVFGEIGFFLGRPRTADVITDMKSLLLKFSYIPTAMDSLINAVHAEQLRSRYLVIRALLKSEIFRSVPPDCFDALIFAGELKAFTPGQTICAQGNAGDSCYIIVQGSVIVSRDGNDIQALSEGSCFGEVALIMTGGRRSASVRAKSEVMTLEIQFHEFYQLLARNFMLACAFETMALSRLRNDARTDSLV